MSDDLVGEVDRAIKDGDADRVYQLVHPLKEKERRAAAKDFRDIYERITWNWEKRGESKYFAATMAWAGTATARQLATGAWSLQQGADWQVDERFYQLIVARVTTKRVVASQASQHITEHRAT